MDSLVSGKRELIELNKQIASKSKAQLARFKVTMPDLEGAIDFDKVEAIEIKSNLTRFSVNRSGASHNTLKMQTSVVNNYIRFCKSVNCFSFPIDIEVTLAYLGIKKEQGFANSTLRQIRNMLSRFSVTLGLPSITTHADIRDFFSSIDSDAAELGLESHIQKQAKPFRYSHYLQLHQHYNPFNAIEARDKAFIAIAYSTVMRVSEVRNIQINDISEVSEGRLRVKRRKSKTTNKPRPKHIKPEFVTDVQLYLSTYTDSDQKYLFPSTNRTGKIAEDIPLSSKTADRIFKRADYTIHGDNPESPDEYSKPVFSGHSTRVGAIQDLYLKKVGIERLVRAGDWKNDTMVYLYLRSLIDEDDV